MRAPAFWWRVPPAPLAGLLRPAGLIYGGIAARRLGGTGAEAGLPVICIGNFTAGGAGKTPTALDLAGRLLSAGERPAFLSRGYGGSLAGPVRVEAHHRAAEVGDEPLLLASRAPAIVSRDRPAGARLAVAAGASVLIMDDGLQNPSLRKDLRIAVVDAATGIGNGLPLPAGPLRAPMRAQWRIVDAVLVIGSGAAGDRLAQEARELGKPVFRAALAPDEAVAAELRDRPVLAFAGIGRPEKFFETLRACGARLEATRSFPDHHPYTETDLAGLRQEATKRGLKLVTTEKDRVRIGTGADRGEDPLLVVPVRLRHEDETRWHAFVLDRVTGRGSGG